MLSLNPVQSIESSITALILQHQTLIAKNETRLILCGYCPKYVPRELEQIVLLYVGIISIQKEISPCLRCSIWLNLCDIENIKQIEILADDAIFSPKGITVAHTFWSDNVLILSHDRRQEIAISLYAEMFRAMPECREIFLRGSIVDTASKFLGMIGWLIMELSSHNADVWSKVKQLGKVHRNYGISYEHYLPMLKVFHKTFEDRFKNSYTLQVKFWIENLFMNAATLMTEKDFVTLFAEKAQDLETFEFFDSLDACLAHKTGREYFEDYLQSTYCNEYVVFLRSFDEYKQIGNIQHRFEKAHGIYEKHFHNAGGAFIDLKKDQASDVQDLKNELDKYKKSLLLISNTNSFFFQRLRRRATPKIYQLPDTLLDVLYVDVKQLIEEHLWNKFHDHIKDIIKQAYIASICFHQYHSRNCKLKRRN